MRKYILSSAMIGAIAGGWNVLQASKHGPRDWRLALMWLGWACSTAVAIGTIIKDADERQIEG
ncbi:MAG: hypothetical protein JWQ68_380 [Cryobacterium sp.]|jgi:hypothetical protein|nr:hypothetical protein [Cryobacterium sp.]